MPLQESSKTKFSKRFNTWASRSLSSVTLGLVEQFQTARSWTAQRLLNDNLRMLSWSIASPQEDRIHFRSLTLAQLVTTFETAMADF